MFEFSFKNKSNIWRSFLWKNAAIFFENSNNAAFSEVSISKLSGLLPTSIINYDNNYFKITFDYLFFTKYLEIV